MKWSPTIKILRWSRYKGIAASENYFRCFITPALTIAQLSALIPDAAYDVFQIMSIIRIKVQEMIEPPRAFFTICSVTSCAMDDSESFQIVMSRHRIITFNTHPIEYTQVLIGRPSPSCFSPAPLEDANKEISLHFFHILLKDIRSRVFPFKDFLFHISVDRSTAIYGFGCGCTSDAPVLRPSSKARHWISGISR